MDTVLVEHVEVLTGVVVELKVLLHELRIAGIRNLEPVDIDISLGNFESQDLFAGIELDVTLDLIESRQPSPR